MIWKPRQIHGFWIGGHIFGISPGALRQKWISKQICKEPHFCHPGPDGVTNFRPRGLNGKIYVQGWSLKASVESYMDWRLYYRISYRNLKETTI